MSDTYYRKERGAMGNKDFGLWVASNDACRESGTPGYAISRPAEQLAELTRDQGEESEAIAELMADAPALLYALMAVRPLLLAHYDAHTAFRDQLREGRVPVPVPAYEGEDALTHDVICRITALIQKHAN